MQPLYSVDHETRQNSNRVEPATPQEDTPLLRFPMAPQERSLFMSLTVSLLLFILITGVIIGIYLLVLQSNAENILPPVDTPLQLVSRSQWGARSVRAPAATAGRAAAVVVVQTDSAPCADTHSCERLLNSLQAAYSSTDVLPYNFLVSSNGQTFAALGWHRPSPLLPRRSDALVLAFIGNFTETKPARAQIDETRNFIAESVSQQHLDPNYVVSGKAIAYEPTGLFDALKSLPRWNGVLLL